MAVLLEDNGGSGTAGSHWDERYLFNEYMTVVAWSPLQKTTKFTLSLLEDTGWYLVDYDY